VCLLYIARSRAEPASRSEETMIGGLAEIQQAAIDAAHWEEVLTKRIAEGGQEGNGIGSKWLRVN
jgi:hypothetical protein